MEIVAPNAEVERSVEVGSHAELLTQLPRVLFGEILGEQPVTTAQLRISEYRRGNIAFLVDKIAWVARRARRCATAGSPQARDATVWR